MSRASKRTRLDLRGLGAMESVLKGAMRQLVQTEADYPLDPESRQLVMKAHGALCEAWLHIANKGT